MTNEELIKIFKERLEYKENALYWKTGPKQGKLAGYKAKDGRIQVAITLPVQRYKLYYAHQIIFAIYNNYIAELVDHKDMDNTNNHPYNLRDATKQLNGMNRGIPKDNTSGVKGVYLIKKTGRWKAAIGHNFKSIHIGVFDTKEEAAIARKRWEEVNHVN